MTSQNQDASSQRKGVITPLLAGSFSRLSTSSRSSQWSSNHSRDSGIHDTSSSSYNSSFASSSDTRDSDFFSLYSSTPLARSSQLLDRRTNHSTNFTPPVNTPLSSQRWHRQQLSEDGIYPASLSGPLSEEDSQQQEENLLSTLIRRRVGTGLIFRYLREEDLLNLCQVSKVFCSSVCDDRNSLKRLSLYLTTEHQNVENRATRRIRRSYGPILGQIQNLPSFNSSAGAGMDVIEAVPSALEAVNVDRVPKQLKSLIETTRSLGKDEYVVSCHSCSGFSVVGLAKNMASRCSKCQTTARSTKLRNRKLKTSLIRDIHR